jgi:lysophospholipase L1-like esterase
MKDKIKVVCIGDSITEGYGIDGKPSAPYPAQLQEMLGDTYQVYNQGVSCTCTINRRLNDRIVGRPYRLEEKCQEAIELKGDIYIVMHGTNDAQDGFDDESGVIDDYFNVYAFRDNFKEDYLSLVNEMKKANQMAEIFIIKPVPVMDCIWKKHQQSYLESILPNYEIIKAENPSYLLVDLQNVFMEYALEDRKKLYQADGLHPSEEGAKVIAQNISRAIKQYSRK